MKRLLEGRGLLPVLLRLALGLHKDGVRLFLGFEERLFLAGFRVALGVFRNAKRLLLGPADRFGGDALTVGNPDGEYGRGDYERSDRRNDERSHHRQHASRPYSKGPCPFPVVRYRNGGRPLQIVETKKRPRFAVWGGR